VARFDVRLTVKIEGAAAIVTKATVKRNGTSIFAPELRSAPGERAIVSTTDGPEAPFLFLVVEADRTTRSQVDRAGLDAKWRPAEKTVDGHRIVPPRLLESVPPVYPEEAKKKGIEGLVVLRLRLDEEGKSGDVEVVQGQPEGLTEAAIAAVKAWRYAPATEGGMPVAVTYTVTINFKLDKSKEP
jgi:TonB family protein